MSINKQCKLLGVPRSSYYHKPKRKLSLEDELLMQAIDRIYLEEPTYGSRRMLDELQLLGYRFRDPDSWLKNLCVFLVGNAVWV
jgi:putative transposase